jgi:prepilin-type N-terminal cleavage/methylation domain-containing protein/prepilin-type processing-associated H-X9-DG protein
VFTRGRRCQSYHPPSSILHSRFRSQHAFTLLELSVAIAIIGILVAIFVPYLQNVREMNNRVRCVDHLRQIQAALDQYGRANHNDYPAAREDPAKSGYVAYTGANVIADPFAPDSPVQPNDVTASLWLLVRQGLAAAHLFICPSIDRSATAAANADRRHGNFPSPAALSYSYATPFSGLPDYHLNRDRVRAEFVVMADMNPGVRGADDNVVGPAKDADLVTRSRGNSRNHKKAGQNVLFGDGHVEWATSHYCGFAEDNIYTALRATAIPPGDKPPAAEPGVLGREIGPAWHADSYLVPTRNDAP